LAAGGFNADGRAALVTAHFTGSTASVLPNTPVEILGETVTGLTMPLVYR